MMSLALQVYFDHIQYSLKHNELYEFFELDTLTVFFPSLQDGECCQSLFLGGFDIARSLQELVRFDQDER
jgi:hypothetical protein